MDTYVRIVADVFVNGRYVEEMLRAEGFAAYLGEWPSGLIDTRTTLQYT
jgi:endonuclease YncB( thermonuclease family)